MRPYRSCTSATAFLRRTDRTSTRSGAVRYARKAEETPNTEATHPRRLVCVCTTVFSVYIYAVFGADVSAVFPHERGTACARGEIYPAALLTYRTARTFGTSVGAELKLCTDHPASTPSSSTYPVPCTMVHCRGGDMAIFGDKYYDRIDEAVVVHNSDRRHQ